MGAEPLKRSGQPPDNCDEAMQPDHPRCEILIQLARRLRRDPDAPVLDLWLDTVTEDGLPAEAARVLADEGDASHRSSLR